MNTLLAPQRPSGIPETLPQPRRDAPLSLFDRLAMRIGWRLVLWGTRRTRRAPLDRERLLLAYRNQEARAAREREGVLDALLAPRL